MRLVCPKCSAEYDVDAALIPEEGREVQCASCHNIWFQDKMATPPPLVLNPSRHAAPEPEPAPAPRPARKPIPRVTPDPDPEEPQEIPARARPSPFKGLSNVEDPALDGQVPQAPRPASAVPPEERRFLREAAEEEIALNRGTDQTAATPAPEAPQQNTSFSFTKTLSEADTTSAAAKPETPAAEDEEELLRSLREQLALGDDDEEIYRGPKPTGRRSVAEAAANAGVTGVAAGAASAASETSGARAGRPDLMSRYFEANEEEDADLFERRRGTGGYGLFTALTLGLIALAVYRFEPEIAKRVPQASPYLSQYVSIVDGARTSVEGLYAEARVMISDMSASSAG